MGGGRDPCPDCFGHFFRTDESPKNQCLSALLGILRDKKKTRQRQNNDKDKTKTKTKQRKRQKQSLHLGIGWDHISQFPGHLGAGANGAPGEVLLKPCLSSPSSSPPSISPSPYSPSLIFGCETFPFCMNGHISR